MSSVISVGKNRPHILLTTGSTTDYSVYCLLSTVYCLLSRDYFLLSTVFGYLKFQQGRGRIGAFLLARVNWLVTAALFTCNLSALIVIIPHNVIISAQLCTVSLNVLSCLLFAQKRYINHLINMTVINIHNIDQISTAGIQIFIRLHT